MSVSYVSVSPQKLQDVFHEDQQHVQAHEGTILTLLQSSLKLYNVTKVKIRTKTIFLFHRLYMRISAPISASTEDAKRNTRTARLVKRIFSNDFNRGFLEFFCMYGIQHCFICRPSDFTVSEYPKKFKSWHDSYLGLYLSFHIQQSPIHFVRQSL